MQSDQPSIQRIADLQQFIADFAGIERMLKLAHHNRRENDAEHSFGLALTCLFLAPKLAPELDLAKILTYALCHDTVEIHSGDTYIFDEDAVATKAEREKSALKILEQEWPDFTEMTQAAKDYMNKANSEAIFVYTVDKMLPSIMVNLGEKNIYWEQNKITREMHEKKKRETMHFSTELEGYEQKLSAWLTNPDYFYKPDENKK